MERQVKKVKLIKPIRYGIRVFEIGEIGEVVDVKDILTFHNESIYDYYVQFDNHKPIGVFKNEIEFLPDTSGAK
jgi:hypothetical protein